MAIPLTHTDNAAHRKLLAQAANPTATTAQLVDISDLINTSADKVLGYAVLNTTTGVLVFASGNTDGGVWHFYDGSTAHTPS